MATGWTVEEWGLFSSPQLSDMFYGIDFYPMGTGGIFGGVKAAGAPSWRNAKIINTGTTLPF
jgi:hypothetical protein